MSRETPPAKNATKCSTYNVNLCTEPPCALHYFLITTCRWSAFGSSKIISWLPLFTDRGTLSMGSLSLSKIVKESPICILKSSSLVPTKFIGQATPQRSLTTSEHRGFFAVSVDDMAAKQKRTLKDGRVWNWLQKIAGMLSLFVLANITPAVDERATNYEHLASIWGISCFMKTDEG